MDPVSHRPAVAVSDDRGRTWSSPTLPAPVCPDADCAPELSTLDGTIVNAVVVDPSRELVLAYRTDAAGDWRRLDTDALTDVDSAWSYVRADGTLALCTYSRNHSGTGCRHWAVRPGAATVQPATVDGWPAGATSVRRSPDGWFFTTTNGPDGALYGSRDGGAWTRITP
jgi:hypothetical protein